MPWHVAPLLNLPGGSSGGRGGGGGSPAGSGGCLGTGRARPPLPAAGKSDDVLYLRRECAIAVVEMVNDCGMAALHLAPSLKNSLLRLARRRDAHGVQSGVVVHCKEEDSSTIQGLAAWQVRVQLWPFNSGLLLRGSNARTKQMAAQLAAPDQASREKHYLSPQGGPLALLQSPPDRVHPCAELPLPPAEHWARRPGPLVQPGQGGAAVQAQCHNAACHQQWLPQLLPKLLRNLRRQPAMQKHAAKRTIFRLMARSYAACSAFFFSLRNRVKRTCNNLPRDSLAWDARQDAAMQRGANNVPFVRHNAKCGTAGTAQAPFTHLRLGFILPACSSAITSLSCSLSVSGSSLHGPQL